MPELLILKPELISKDLLVSVTDLGFQLGQIAAQDFRQRLLFLNVEFKLHPDHLLSTCLAIACLS
ncbi:hypothetical protein [Sulfuritalea sp.]|uniref:hypothetical protein n=1 Tax=Sulfuritalea sp. TaxID=2480090 RepID=UPI00286E7B66|nr:hypothetical protein [Sulfuritalea sp.]